jgi:hypothetical protein
MRSRRVESSAASVAAAKAASEGSSGSSNTRTAVEDTAIDAATSGKANGPDLGRRYPWVGRSGLPSLISVSYWRVEIVLATV